MGSKMTRWIDQVLNPGFHKFCPAGTWSPSINLYEDDGFFYMIVDLAGVKSEQVDLRVEKGTLMLSGERETPQPSEADSPIVLHLMEIDHGHFCRSLELPEEVITDDIQASYKCGYLWIRMPKRK